MLDGYIRYNKVVYLTQYYVIWSPKYRRQLLVGNLKERLSQVIKQVCLEENATLKALEIMPDHVHLLISYSYKYPINKLVKALKGRSSNLLRKEFPELLKMPTLWTRSLFVCTVGQISEETIKEYIESQWAR